MIVRTPVLSACGGLRVLGVDTGFANIGLCVVQSADGRTLRCLHAEAFRTQKMDKKIRRSLRVSADDARRLREAFDRIHEIVTRFNVDGIAVEVYSPNPAQRGVGSWKTAMVYSIVLALAWSTNIAVFSNLPVDIKKPFGGRITASKEAVAETLVQRVQNFRGIYEGIPKTLQEHVSDACAHAVLGVQEMFSLRKMMGVR